MSFATNVKALARTAGAWGKHHAPEILMAGGAVSFVATIVTASKATIKAQDILEEHREVLRDIKLAEATPEEYSEEDKRHDVIVAYSRTSFALAKNFAPAAGFATLSLTCFFASYGIMRKRYVALGAAYTALNKSFQLYRQRVIEDRGQDTDTYYLTGVKPASITTTGEDGKKEKKKVVKDVNGNEVANPYMFKFGKYKENGERNNQWSKEQMMNRAFIYGQKDYLDDQLYLRCVFNKDHYVLKRGCVMLNELRDLLGEDPTTAGSITGWRYSNGEPGCNGYIDLNLVEGIEIDPETGEEIPCYWINPNVDGLIFDKLDEWEKKPFQPSIPRWGESDE